MHRKPQIYTKEQVRALEASITVSDDDKNRKQLVICNGDYTCLWGFFSKSRRKTSNNTQDMKVIDLNALPELKTDDIEKARKIVGEEISALFSKISIKTSTISVEREEAGRQVVTEAEAILKKIKNRPDEKSTLCAVFKTITLMNRSFDPAFNGTSYRNLKQNAKETIGHPNLPMRFVGAVLVFLGISLFTLAILGIPFTGGGAVAIGVGGVAAIGGGISLLRQAGATSLSKKVDKYAETLNQPLDYTEIGSDRSRGCMRFTKR